MLPLDRVAEAIGALSVSSDDIDAIFGWLEQHGRVIGEPTLGPASLSLPQVLSTARLLRTSLGRTPKAAEIAEQSGLTLDAVQRALLFSKILQR